MVGNFYVSLSLILALPLRECLGKRSCMSSTFPEAILNGTHFAKRKRRYKFVSRVLLD